MATNSKPAKAVLSGSYAKDIAGLTRAYDELVTTGCQVLSPHSLDFDASEFARTMAEQPMSECELENYHLMCIRQADFVWLHAPGGYVGTSSAFEIGYALANHCPIFSKSQPLDIMLRQYVQLVPSVFEVRQRLRT